MFMKDGRLNVYFKAGAENTATTSILQAAIKIFLYKKPNSSPTWASNPRQSLTLTTDQRVSATDFHCSVNMKT